MRVETSNRAQRPRRWQSTKGSAQPSEAQVTEAEVNAVLQAPQYRQAGLTRAAARQVAQLKAAEAQVRQERAQAEEQYQKALLKTGRQEMEGWARWPLIMALGTTS